MHFDDNGISAASNVRRKTYIRKYHFRKSSKTVSFEINMLEQVLFEQKHVRKENLLEKKTKYGETDRIYGSNSLLNH